MRSTPGGFAVIGVLLVAAVAHAAPADELRVALSVRHDPPTCARLSATWEPDALREALLEVARPEVQPPWASMRAAACVISLAGHDPAALTAVLAWIDDPAVPGFALEAVDALPELPEAAAVKIATRALARRWDKAAWEERVAEAVRSAPQPGVRALAR